MDNLFADHVLGEYVSSLNLDKDTTAVVSPDAAGVERAIRIADKVARLKICLLTQTCIF